MVGPNQAFDIGWAKAVAVELALLIALEYGIISSTHSAGTSFLVCSDNQGVMTVINKGRSCSEQTNRVLKQMYRLLARNQLSLHSEYITSRENVTNALSRGNIPTFLHGFPHATTQAHISLPQHLEGKLISW